MRGKIIISKKRWVFNPNSGGVKIPDSVKVDITKRINKCAEENYSGRYTSLHIRFRGHFCYIDAFTEPLVSDNWPPDDWPESREEMIERLRSTPVHLCRLRYFGDDKWGYAFYTYSSEKYQLSVFSDGNFTGKPEDAFALSAIHLS